MNISNDINRIFGYINQIEEFKQLKKKVAESVADLNNLYEKNKISRSKYEKEIDKILNKKTQKDWVSQINKNILDLLAKIEVDVHEIYKQLFVKEISSSNLLPAPEPGQSKVGDEEYLLITSKRKKALSSELKIERKNITKFIQKRRSTLKRKKIKEDYTLYNPGAIEKIANKIFKDTGNSLINKYPQVFDSLIESLKVSNVNMLTNTYINIMLLSSLISFVLSLFILLFIFSGNVLFLILKTIFTSLFIALIILVMFYFYPISRIKTRRTRIRSELPFIAIHMAAVSGSGAPPYSIFKLILESDEYPALKSEIKKIINFINLFGYNLTTALKRVALETPSPEFKELLIGMVTSIETGGDLKDYLNNKSKELLSTYRLDREKYVESLSAISDIYTGVMIAAPLLIIVTLAIINVIGGDIGGLSVESLAKLGTFIVIPFMNIIFLLLVDIIQPEI